MESICEYYIKNKELVKCIEQEEVAGGVSIYEVIRIEKGIPLFFEDHFHRLLNSFKLASQKLWISFDDIKRDISILVNKNKVTIGNIKLVFNINEGNSEYQAYFIEHHYPSELQFKEGVSTILYNRERKNRNAKIIDKTLREEVNKELEKKGVYEAILVDNKGYITEGSRSNIFLLKNNTLYTSPLEDVLPGITRKYIILCCKNLGVNFLEERVKATDISTFQGLFISGTSPKVLPISKVDDINYFSANNEIILMIKEEYDRIIYNYIKNSLEVI